MKAKIKQSLTEDQFGFRKNMETRKAILALRIIIPKRIRKDEQIFMAFAEAFGNVNWTVMFNMKVRIKIKYADRRLLYNLYNVELAVIKIQVNI